LAFPQAATLQRLVWMCRRPDYSAPFRSCIKRSYDFAGLDFDRGGIEGNNMKGA
jgi:hypothetical protein